MTRKTWLCWTLVALATAIVVVPVHWAAAADVPSQSQVERWIRELGDDDYQVRKEAAERLAQGGETVRAALAEVAEGVDPETRFAARRLMTLIADSEFAQRLADFAADVDGSRGVSLPGWKEFSELVGSDAAARDLFVDMQREESQLLERVFDASSTDRQIDWENQVGRMLRARIISNPGQLAVPAGSSATLLFLGALPDAKISDAGASGLRQLTQIPPLSESLAVREPKNAIRRLVCAWIVQCPNRSPVILQQRLDAMFQNSLSECLPLAIDMLEPNPEYLSLLPQQQMLAILAVGKFGSEEHLSVLEPYLSDTRECMPRQRINGPGGDLGGVQLRDVALAALLQLTGQEPVAYGFLRIRPHPQMLFDVSSLSLDEGRRATALEQWRVWRAQHTPAARRPASS